MDTTHETKEFPKNGSERKPIVETQPYAHETPFAMTLLGNAIAETRQRITENPTSLLDRIAYINLIKFQTELEAQGGFFQSIFIDKKPQEIQFELDGENHTVPQYLCVQKPVGGGGQGQIYLAFDLKNKEVKAIKYIPNTQDYEEQKKAITEAKTGRAIYEQGKSTHFVKVDSYFSDNRGNYYIVMNYLNPDIYPTLAQVMRSRREEYITVNQDKLSFEDIENIKNRRTAISEPFLDINYVIATTCGIAVGLEDLHTNGYIHHDLKPGNIDLAYPYGYSQETPPAKKKDKLLTIPAALLIPNSNEVVLDLGIINQKNADNTDTLRGTLPYMCLDKISTPKSDVYSLGLVVLEMLTGYRIFSNDIADIMYKHQQRRANPQEAHAEIKTALETALKSSITDEQITQLGIIIDQATHEDPSERHYETPTSFALAIVQVFRPDAQSLDTRRPPNL